MNADCLKNIYAQIKEHCSVTLTTTAALNEGFTIDVPVLCGEARGLIWWLYLDDDLFVFSHAVANQDYHNHCHPQSVDEAIQAILKFTKQ